MACPVVAHHDLSPIDIDAIEERLYDHNKRALGCDDGKGLAYVIRDEAENLIAAVAGYSWAGTAEIKQLWVDESCRRRGYAMALLIAFETEAFRRGVRQIWVASYDFQAPAIYEKSGFERVVEFPEWPEGHSNIILRKLLDPN